MSVIEKMSIMGIRSFGPEDHNRQVIEFFRPLTLILGPNGSGKTTIIECLRYMTTGDPPPNSDRGGSFVYDPKFAGEREVRGQAKLQLKDVLGRKVVVTRSLQVTQALKKLTLKTLEGSITRFGANGEKTQLSSKCAEIDAEMIGALGVSKPILNHVIFCHQEESNWPLGEGKALKQKFDDIFAATRYIKALDEIVKIRKEKMVNIKSFQVEVDSLAKNKQKAEEFQKDLEKTETRLSVCRDQIHEVEEKLKPISEKLGVIAQKQDAIGKLEGQLDTTLSFIAKCERDERTLRGSIKDLFEGSKEDLQGEMNNFNAQVQQKKKRLEKIQQELNSLQKKYQSDQKIKSQLIEELGKLKADHERHVDAVRERDGRLRTARAGMGLGECVGEDDEALDAAQVASVLRNLRQRDAASRSHLSDVKKKLEAAESQLSEEVQKNTLEKAKKQMELQNANHQMAKNKTTIRNISNELQRLDLLANRQDSVKMDLDEAEEELRNEESTEDVEKLRQELAQKRAKKKEMDKQLTDLNTEMRVLQKESKIRFEIDSLSKEFSSKQEAAEKMLSRHRETLIHLLQQVPEHSAYDRVKEAIDDLNRKIHVVNKNLETERSTLASLETTKKFQMTELAKKKEMLSANQNKIFDTCGSQDFEHGFESLKNNIKELQDEKGAVTGSLYLYNKYVEKLKKPRACCPLCTRSFNSDQQSQQLVEKLQQKLESMPNKLEQKTKLIADKEQLLSKMTELKPVKEMVTILLKNEIPELEKKIEKAVSCISELETKVSEGEDSLDGLRCDLEMANNIVPDIVLLEQGRAECDRLKRRLSALSTQVSSKDTSRTIQQVGDEQTCIQEQMRSAGAAADVLQERIDACVERVQALRTRINDLREEQNTVCSDLQKRTQLTEQSDALAAENERLAAANKKINAEIAVFDAKVKKFLDEKDAATKTKEKELEKINLKMRDEERETDSIEKLSQEIDKYTRENKEEKKLEHEDRVNELTQQLNHRKEEISRQTTLEKELCRNIDSQESKRRDLEDNLKLIAAMEEIAELRARCDDLRAQLGGCDAKSIRKEGERLVREERDLRRSRDEACGREAGFREKVRDWKKLLRDELYCDATHKHSDKLIELRTTQLAVDDLGKYYTALNKAIMSYHRMKMQEINKIIKDLWYKTYAGNDIDYIEIASDEEGGGLEKGRRTFNYRVVMVKGDTATDMRGRCSAGQKVLASLIIRLALAETFCLSCGILALDEPTTNLDRENIAKLAKALVDIVGERSEQRNFQLIVITHDEDFIELLGRSHAVDYFYKVSKDSSAFSKVSKLYISDIP